MKIYEWEQKVLMRVFGKGRFFIALKFFYTKTQKILNTCTTCFKIKKIFLWYFSITMDQTCFFLSRVYVLHVICKVFIQCFAVKCLIHIKYEEKKNIKCQGFNVVCSHIFYSWKWTFKVFNLVGLRRIFFSGKAMSFWRYRVSLLKVQVD